MCQNVKKFLTLITLFFSISLIYLSIRFFISYKKYYGYSIMDWNQDGKTSLREVVESTDIGARQVILNGTECVEYFFCKDGLPIKIVCR